MASSGVNVARWSALFAGVVYGIYHQRSIRTHQRLDEVKRKYYNEESLIAKAKAAYLEKTLPPEKRAPGGGVISDPEDPKFDLEAYLTMKSAEEPK